MVAYVFGASARAARLRALIVPLAAALLLPLLPAGAAAQQEEVTPARVRGLQRFETAARIADLTFDEAEVAILASGYDFPDALAGSLAATRENGPILLVESDDVPGSTLGMLDELGVSRVIILGGREVVGFGVERRLQQEGYPFERIAGKNRYETAAEIARRYGRDAQAQLNGRRTAILASGRIFADALAAGPFAARGELPLLLTPPDRTLQIVDDTLAQLEIEHLVVVGGEVAVSNAVVEHYRNQGYTIERLAGATREATATIVADTAIARLEGFSARLVLLARGDDFPDALAASMHGAVRGAPILLTTDPETLGGPTEAWLEQRCPDVEVIRALGGTAAVAEATLRVAVEAAGRCLNPNQEVARFTTPLLGIPDRTHNIHLGADYIDGDVIAAGATYSLNQGIGRRTRARGFREVENGCIGSGGEAVDCVGGGVSQLATTFMNAAWFSGISFHEFRQHSIFFERYPICHEATISWGSLDVVVHNNSPFDIIIDAFYTDEFIGVRFISREWATVQSWSEPDNPPGSGSFTSRCGRTISYPDGTSDTESYTWTYDDTGF